MYMNMTLLHTETEGPKKQPDDLPVIVMSAMIYILTHLSMIMMI